jgi:transposase
MKSRWRLPATHGCSARPYSGHITKQGCKLGRTVLVQCAMIAARYSPYLQAFYRRIAATRGAGKAIIALARKFLGIIYKTLKNKWVFGDFPAFKLARC